MARGSLGVNVLTYMYISRQVDRSIDIEVAASVFACLHAAKSEKPSHRGVLVLSTSGAAFRALTRHSDRQAVPVQAHRDAVPWPTLTKEILRERSQNPSVGPHHNCPILVQAAG